MTAFARDIDGGLLCLDGEGTVCIFDADEKAIMQKTGETLGQQLESIRDRCLSGKLIYEKDVGLMAVA